MSQVLPFIMAGYPTHNAHLAQLAAAKDAGIEAIELGIPHSDPIADGPVLQAAAHAAIHNGTHLRSVLSSLVGLKDTPDIVLFSYFNPLLQIGLNELLEALRDTPVRALLVVDLPFGEAPDFETALREAGYPLIPLLTPTTSIERAKQVLAERPDPGPQAPFAQRFAYVVARLGITGENTHAFDDIHARVQALQGITERPLAVGFGLGDANSLQRVRAMGVTPIVGSALVEALGSTQPLATTFAALTK
ncbi:tryptophan synthase subunit alpha [Lysobacter sp. HDW10]|uniref:tryptophan synthase subunit alpha n=1 Tax=Lysobacter sp. HDW10 TaxID=2714936 RepID=UPI0014090D97|nr:tryptophan synthase subunit alpha [Lysobacter sp. HDW10]QIK80691.1 tryptophan synthase subunit alpha [Lysobacter sp. HDW10]